MTLPQGWAAVDLLDVVALHDSRRIPLNQAQRTAMPGDYPYYGANGQVGTVGDYLFEGEHILLAEDGGYFDQPERGVAYRADGKFWVNNHAHILSTLGDMPASFLERALNLVDWMQIVSGTTRLKLTQGGLARVSLAIPPLAEQRRIVGKLDALTARLASARAELDRVPVLAAKLRRTILDQAFSGALTAECRNDQSNEAVPPPELDDQERGLWTGDVLPSSWQWVPFSAFFADRTDTYRKLPTSEYLADGPFPVIDQGVGQVGGYTDRVELIHSATERVVIFGDHTRCCKLVDPPFVQGADGIKVLAAAVGVDINYARYALMAVAIPAKGYSRHMKFVRRTIWPLAPLAEQRQIVRRIEAAFARADRMEAEAARARALIDRLASAILARAFRGELVPQDPADEPASVLLDRIRAQRAAAPKPKRGRRPDASTK